MRRERPSRTRWVARLAVLALALAPLAGAAGCDDDDDDSSAPTPVLDNINNSSDPASPTNQLIELNGSGFQSSGGKVVFTEGSIVAEVVPPDSAWTDDSILVEVPAQGDGGTDFTVPSTDQVEVTVETSGGTTDPPITLDLVETPTFSVENMTYGTTTALPSANRGLGAVPVPDTSTNAHVVIAGGNTSAGNVAEVWSNSINNDGTVDTWVDEANDLPQSRALHGMAVAHESNSLVGAGNVFIYVVAGQELEGDSPGGTDTVYVASVDPTNGAVGSWSQTSTLPAPRVGPAVVTYNGFVYVVGGLDANGDPTDTVWSAGINSDGTISSWSSQDPLPVSVAFARGFGFGGRLYVVGGRDTSPTNDDPWADSGLGRPSVYRARADDGNVSDWTRDGNDTIQERFAHDLFISFGQVLLTEGRYNGAASNSNEAERSQVDTDGTLQAWNGIASTTNQPGLGVFHGASIVSPIRPTNEGPRFLFFGGDDVDGTTTVNRISTVTHNTGP